MLNVEIDNLQNCIKYAKCKKLMFLANEANCKFSLNSILYSHVEYRNRIL